MINKYKKELAQLYSKARENFETVATYSKDLIPKGGRGGFDRGRPPRRFDDGPPRRFGGGGGGRFGDRPRRLDGGGGFGGPPRRFGGPQNRFCAPSCAMLKFKNYCKIENSFSINAFIQMHQ